MQVGSLEWLAKHESQKVERNDYSYPVPEPVHFEQRGPASFVCTDGLNEHQKKEAKLRLYASFLNWCMDKSRTKKQIQAEAARLTEIMWRNL